MPNLDGKDEIKPTPFDAHEKVVRNTHNYSRTEGYAPSEHEHREYPKAIDHDKETGEPVLAKDADHEDELLSKPKPKGVSVTPKGK